MLMFPLRSQVPRRRPLQLLVLAAFFIISTVLALGILIWGRVRTSSGNSAGEEHRLEAPVSRLPAPPRPDSAISILPESAGNSENGPQPGAGATSSAEPAQAQEQPPEPELRPGPTAKPPPATATQAARGGPKFPRFNAGRPKLQVGSQSSKSSSGYHGFTAREDRGNAPPGEVPAPPEDAPGYSGPAAASTAQSFTTGDLGLSQTGRRCWPSNTDKTVLVVCDRERMVEIESQLKELKAAHSALRESEKQVVRKLAALRDVFLNFKIDPPAAQCRQQETTESRYCFFKQDHYVLDDYVDWLNCFIDKMDHSSKCIWENFDSRTGCWKIPFTCYDQGWFARLSRLDFDYTAYFLKFNIRHRPWAISGLQSGGMRDPAQAPNNDLSAYQPEGCYPDSPSCDANSCPPYPYDCALYQSVSEQLPTPNCGPSHYPCFAFIRPRFVSSECPANLSPHPCQQGLASEFDAANRIQSDALSKFKDALVGPLGVIPLDK